MLQRWLCRIGLHRFEADPSHKELLKETGVHVAFWSEAMQKGTKRCTCEGCDATLKVYRRGLCGIGGNAGPWKRLSTEREAAIDALPTL